VPSVHEIAYLSGTKAAVGEFQFKVTVEPSTIPVSPVGGWIDRVGIAASAVCAVTKADFFSASAATNTGS
jgi:hypothetical protein